MGLVYVVYMEKEYKEEEYRTIFGVEKNTFFKNGGDCRKKI